MYDFMMKYESRVQPSMIHLTNTVDYHFYFRHFLHKLISRFIVEGLPETWDEDYLKIVLFLAGNVWVVDTESFGVIPQYAVPYGYDVYYRPTNIVIANPAFKSTDKTRYKISEDTEGILLTPDWLGVADLINSYAQRAAMIASDGDVAGALSKYGYLCFAKDKASAETFKTVFDDITSGKLAVASNKSFFDEAGRKTFEMFSGNVAESFSVCTKAYDYLQKLDDDFDKEIGLFAPNKKERLITDEVASTKTAVSSLCELWLDCIQRSTEKVNAMFKLNISWKLRTSDKPESTVTYTNFDEEGGCN